MFTDHRGFALCRSEAPVVSGLLPVGETIAGEPCDHSGKHIYIYIPSLILHYSFPVLGFSPITHGPSCSFYYKYKTKTAGGACPSLRFYLRGG